MNINSTSSSSSNTTDYSRVTGLATGMDTDGMVKQMMSADQAKIDKVKQDEQYTEWQQEAYVGVIKDLKTFYSSYLDILGTDDTNMMKTTAYNGLNATVSTNNSGDNKLSVTTYPGAIKGAYSVQIYQLASGAQAQKSMTSDDLQTKVTAGDIKIEIGSTDSTTKNTFTISATSDMTKSQLIDKLKAATDSSGNSILNYVNINYSEITNSFSIETKNTGSKQTLDITDATGLVNPDSTKTSTVGTDAKVRIKAPGQSDYPSGDAGIITKSSNSFIIDNLKLDLQDITTNDTSVDSKADAVTAATEITFNVKADATDSITKIKKFVDAYNTLISNMSSKITEKKNYDYKPLTDVQKAGMTADQITQWETQAKKGILRNESNLQNLLNSMRTALYNTVKGAGINITDIGISTTSNIDDGGKLQIDESKLKTALETRSDQVYKLFTQSGSTDEEKGIFQRFKDVVNSNIGTDGVLIKKAGYEKTRFVVSNELSKKITEQKQRIADLQESFKDKQQRYYNMFATLESNMNRLNSQSSWLTSALSSG